MGRASRSPPVIPLLHDLDGETVLVFGGGSVGARKARRLGVEASVVVVSPEFAAADFGDAALVRARPTEDAIGDWLQRLEPVLVIAATDDADFNDAVEAAARDDGRLVNRADVAGSREAGSVVLPAIARDGPVVVGVGTGGASPALAAALRDRVADEIEGAGTLAELTGELRTELADAGVPPATRRAAIRRVVAASEVWTALDTGRSKTRQVAIDVIEDATGDRP